jgi:hypothetical protein
VSACEPADILSSGCRAPVLVGCSRRSFQVRRSELEHQGLDKLGEGQVRRIAYIFANNVRIDNTGIEEMRKYPRESTECLELGSEHT